ncbi:hypothetical protein FA95DRAFT_1113574 [Auriscalpium vulgare]|uniref:Uncharacterized protein n=1 Tax=Auriscalpium vulgare TaxID=40419 RepID=A0ACB8R5Y0_9AGAM|nr:hypothetical protein FA95DRAFT_1113574 [Auriscalpium vulgare]
MICAPGACALRRSYEAVMKPAGRLRAYRALPSPFPLVSPRFPRVPRLISPRVMPPSYANVANRPRPAPSHSQPDTPLASAVVPHGKGRLLMCRLIDELRRVLHRGERAVMWGRRNWQSQISEYNAARQEPVLQGC